MFSSRENSLSASRRKRGKAEEEGKYTDCSPVESYTLETNGGGKVSRNLFIIFRFFANASRGKNISKGVCVEEKEMVIQNDS